MNNATNEQKAWYTYGYDIGRLEMFKFIRERLTQIGIITSIFTMDDLECELVDAATKAKERAQVWNPKQGRRHWNCKHYDPEKRPEACAACEYVRAKWEPETEKGDQA